MFPIFAGNSASTGYNLTRSLRTRASASAYLNRTPAAAGNRQTWTWSAWVKRGLLGASLTMLDGGATGPLCDFEFQSNDTIRLYVTDSGVGTSEVVVTTAVFRDPAAWYHIMCVLDTTQATVANRVKIYVNNVQQTVTGLTGTLITQNSNQGMNRAIATNIGRYSYVPQNYFDGYLTEINFIDGQALTPSSFGSTNALTGVWQPARYTGTYGTNGFYLPFTDNSALTTSSNVGLGKDFSGNGNYWTTNNISITAGVTYDSMTDVPTLTSATAANFAVLNPINLPSGVSVLEGNLKWSGGGVYSLTRATMAIPLTGKYYWEITPTTAPASGASSMYTGVTLTTSPNTNFLEQDSPSCGYLATNGNIAFSGGSSAYGTTYTTNDVIGVAVDMDNGAIYFAKNNTWQNSGVPTSGASKTGAARTNLAGASLQPSLAVNTSFSVTAVANFGQRPFSYTPPTGFVALNTYNLPTSTIVKGNTVMDATLYTGTLLSNAITNAASFRPDLVWPKSRSAATSNKLTDSVRGVTKALVSNSDSAETTDVQGITAINSNGFTVGTNTDYNNLAATYVAWQWQAGQGSTSSNTNGTITSTVSVNASAGFSIVTYTGNGTNPGATIGHGLGVAPAMIICKNRSNIDWWPSYHVSVGVTNTLYLNDTVKSNTYLNRFSAVSSTTFTTGSSGSELNTSANNYVAYCWTPIAGFSAFGSYTGNGSADGAFIYTGVRAKFVMIKRTDTANDWVIHDTARDTYNLADLVLYPNGNYTESSGASGRPIDILSNGFKCRSTEIAINASGGTYVYATFAENPFKNALAR
jgi:hypothetical protein